MGKGTAQTPAANISLPAADMAYLDEEAARLIQYQQAYQAAARVITASQQMFDALINATN